MRRRSSHPLPPPPLDPAKPLSILRPPPKKDPFTDPNRGPDAPLLDHSCHRLPTRYNGDLLLIMLNGGLGMVRTKNVMPEEWWRQRRARVVRFGFAGLRPWMWFASPFLPYVSTWESAHFRCVVMFVQ